MPVIKSIGYSVHFGKDALKSLSKSLSTDKHSSVFILCDENTLEHCLPVLILNCPKLAEAQLIEMESGESNKTLEICHSIWQTLIEQEADKQSLLINLGGGVLSDLGGFVASVYKRGIDFIHIPTTTLAMADASIGGKTGIDFMGFKNTIGTFAQPKAVFIYPEFLDTLPLNHVLNGWVEIFKMALISDKKLWEELKVLNFENDPDQFILKSLELKNKIVIKDTFDLARRKILNFGHSIGHALESLFIGHAEPLLHGEAVCIGMIIESHIAWQKKHITKKELDEIVQTLKTMFKPKSLARLTLESILSVLKQDKKNLNGNYRFALLNSIGNCSYDETVTEKQIEKAFDEYRQQFA